MNRREFLGAAACAAGACVTGCATSKSNISNPRAPEGDYRALLVHLGHNMWCDWPSEYMQHGKMGDPKFTRWPDLKLRCQDEFWRQETDHFAKTGGNMLFIDLGEGLEYPSHPELAIEGTWSVDKMRKELARLRAMGLEVIPKLNFSAMHNGWMKDFRHMVSSRPYHQFCEDVIRDAAEIFDHPRYIHIGYDEEIFQLDSWCNTKYICVRKDEFWWQDFLQVVRAVEKVGARPWMWSDYGWDHPDFYSRCPKSVVMQNWYYDECYGGFDPKTNKTADLKRLVAYWDLEKAKFDQVPCGTNWSGWMRKKKKVGADDVMGKLVKLCREVIPPERLLGFMIAPWGSPDTQEHTDFTNRGSDLLAAALKEK